MPEAEVEEVVAAEVDDVEGDVSPEEFMARRQAALAKRKPTAAAGCLLARLLACGCRRRGCAEAAAGARRSN